MKVSLNWLREFVPLPESASKLQALLTIAGVEIENIEQRGLNIENVVVAQIVASEPHPNADRLSVCQVDHGSGQTRQIVCGAKNYKVGDKVLLALPGAVLPGDFKIKVGKIRGVESHGMLCSAKELRLSEDAEGLFILPDSAKPGEKLSETFPADEVLSVEITPNRPDLLSHLGLAREVAALTKRELRWSAPAVSRTQRSDSIGIEAPHNCPFYTARRITGIRVAPSPAWLRQKLESIGVRAINNIVDVTNFVMFELGQPLHAFDLDKLSGAVRVRSAFDGEKLHALDGQTYSLTAQNLVIADEEKAIALAGVIGGEQTGVSNSTANVLLESAYFRPANVRRTARNLGLITDSSYRFERGVDPEMIVRASTRAAELICELAGGEAHDFVEIMGDPPNFAGSVKLRAERCRQLLGVHLEETEMDGILTRFGLQKIGDAWATPAYRQDLTREIDLIEEIARVVGIDRIPSRQRSWFSPSTSSDRHHDHQMRLRGILAAQGFWETRTLSLISGEAAARFHVADELARVRNPLNEEQSVLRPSLLPGLLASLQTNARTGSRSMRLFEIGRVFSASEEQTLLGIAMCGQAEPESWRRTESRDADVFDLKGVINALPIADLSFRPAPVAGLVLGLEILSAGEKIGVLGQLPPEEQRELDLRAPAILAEMNIASEVERRRRGFQELEKYPAVVRDIALIAQREITHARIESLLLAQQEPLLERVQLFDLFIDATGEKVPRDHRSMAYSLTYRSKERTLTVDEVNAAHGRLKERLRSELGVQLRE
jgi:phenylalanyl-tRNA synthetase beta chain